MKKHTIFRSARVAFATVMGLSVFGLKNVRAQLSTSPTPGEKGLIQTTLGWGYDAVKGKYANIQSKKIPIFSVVNVYDPTLPNTPGDFIFTRGNSADDNAISGTSTKEFGNDMAAGATIAGSYGLFSGEVEASTKNKSTSSVDNAYAIIVDKRVLFTAKLAPTRRLAKGVLEDLNTMNSEALFMKYGTHYLAGIEYGGSIHYSMSVEASSEMTESTLEGAIKASYGTSVKGSANASDTQKYESTLSEAHIDLYTKGGAQTALNTTDFNTDTQRDFVTGGEYSTWAKSLNQFSPDTVVIADFFGEGLNPIWEVPGITAARAAVLKNAFDAYSRKYGSGLYGREPKKLTEAVKGGASVYLSMGTRYIGTPYESATSYWPNLNTTAQKHQILPINRSTGEVKNGDTVWIKYVGNVSDWGRWEGDVWLYVSNSDTKARYYKNGNGGNYQWKIRLKDPQKPGEHLRDTVKTVIRTGDEVALESVGFAGEYLQEEGTNEMDANPGVKFFKIDLAK